MNVKKLYKAITRQKINEDLDEIEKEFNTIHKNIDKQDLNAAERIIHEMEVRYKTKDKEVVHDTFKHYKEPLNTILYPKEIYNALDNVVVKQTDAKKLLSTVFAAHLSNLHNNEAYIAPKIAIAGPTGNGKTHLLKSLESILDLSFVFLNASYFQGSGWKGVPILTIFDTHAVDQVRNYPQTGMVLKVLHSRLRKVPHFMNYSYYDQLKIIKQECKKIVLVFDEFDKIARRPDEGNQDGSRQEMSDYMNIIDGYNFDFELGSDTERLNYKLTTANFPIIFLGAFSGLEELENIKPFTGMGFLSAENDIENRPLLKSSLHKYGLMPELLGRITTIIKLKKLEADDYKRILDLTILPNFIKLFSSFKMSVGFSPEFKQEIAEQAVKSEEGARALQELVELQIREILFHADEYEYKCVMFTHVGKTEAEIKEIVPTKRMKI